MAEWCVHQKMHELKSSKHTATLDLVSQMVRCFVICLPNVVNNAKNVPKFCPKIFQSTHMCVDCSEHIYICTSW